MQICLVANEMLGAHKNGGIGTATSFLSFALAQLGHDVEILHFGRRDIVSQPWTQRYEDAAITVSHLRGSAVAIRPEYLAASWAIYQYLAERNFDAIIFQDTSAPGFCSLRAKAAGLALTDTLMILYSHSPTGWIAEAGNSFPISKWELAMNAMERLSAENADVLISPSQYMLDWMQSKDWILPGHRRVIPYFSAGTVQPDWIEKTVHSTDVPVKELVFFGRLEDRKGIRVFLDALDQVEHDLLAGRRIRFLGSAATWTPGRIKAEMPRHVRRAVNRILFSTRLSQEESLLLLSRPGVLAVMPSLVDNSPCVIYECLERGIHFLASNTGGGIELVDPKLRSTHTFTPSPSDLARTLSAALSKDDVRKQPEAMTLPDRSDLVSAWSEALEKPRSTPPTTEKPTVSVVLAGGENRSQVQLVEALSHQTYDRMEVLVVEEGGAAKSSKALRPSTTKWVSAVGAEMTVSAARNVGYRESDAELILFLDGDLIPDANLVETLVRAQVKGRSDIVTCGIRFTSSRSGRRYSRVRLFLGEPGELGVIENLYGEPIVLVSKEALDKTGGFAEWTDGQYAVWEFLIQATQLGLRIDALPIDLALRQQKGTSPDGHKYESQRAITRAFGDHLPRDSRLFPAVAHFAYKDRHAQRMLQRRWNTAPGLRGAVQIAQILVGSFRAVIRTEGFVRAVVKAWEYALGKRRGYW